MVCSDGNWAGFASQTHEAKEPQDVTAQVKPGWYVCNAGAATKILAGGIKQDPERDLNRRIQLTYAVFT